MKWRKIAAIMLVVTIALAMIACGQKNSGEQSGQDSSQASADSENTSSGQTSDGKTTGSESGGTPVTLTLAIQDEIEGADIQQIGWENIVQSLIYEPLVVFSSDLQSIEPAFAESYQIAEDGSYIEFVLPAAAKFSNGDVCDAAAVKASTERFLEISEYSEDLAAVKSIEVIDERTIRYHLSGPAPYIWASLTSTYGGVNHAAIAATMEKDAFNRKPVTNGPFYVEEWSQGSQIVLKKNPYFQTNNPFVKNKGPMNVDEIVIRFIPDEFTRVSELESGNVDIIYDVPTASIADLEANSDLKTYRYLQAGVGYINLQTENGVTADPLVRQALTFAIDRDELAAVLDQVVTPMYGFISAAQAGFSEQEEAKLKDMLAFNPDKTKELLTQAGWQDQDGDGLVEKDGQKCTVELLVPSDRATLKNCAPVLQQQLIAAGFDAVIREYEGSYIKQQMKDDNFIMGMRTFVWNDADILYYVFTEASGYPWNDPAVTAALKAAREENNPQARVEKYAEAQQLLLKASKAIALFSDNHCVATKGTIDGLVITNDGRTWLNDLTIQD